MRSLLPVRGVTVVTGVHLCLLPVLPNAEQSNTPILLADLIELGEGVDIRGLDLCCNPANLS